VGFEEGTNRRDYPYHLSTPEGAVGVANTFSGTWVPLSGFGVLVG